MDNGFVLTEDVKKGRESAIKDFDSAISIDPRLFAAYYDKGQMLKSLRRMNEAIVCFHKAIDIGLKTGPSVKLSVIKEEDGQYLGTGHPMVTMSRFRRYVIEHYLSVIVNTRHVVKLTDGLVFISNQDDPLAFAYYNLGVLYGSVGKFATATEMSNQAIRLNPEVPVFYMSRSINYIGMGDIKRATQDQQRVKESVERIKKIVGSE